MILIAQDGTTYDLDAIPQKPVKPFKAEISLFDDELPNDEPANPDNISQITEDFKIQLWHDGKWVTVAEYDSAEELCYVLDCYSVVYGFQNRFVFPERGFYKKFYTSANDSRE